MGDDIWGDEIEPAAQASTERSEATQDPEVESSLPARMSQLARAALIMAVLGACVLPSCTYFLGSPDMIGVGLGMVFLIPMATLVLGYIARTQVRRAQGSLSGLGLTTIALIIGWTEVAVVLLGIGFIVWFLIDCSRTDCLFV